MPASGVATPSQGTGGSTGSGGSVSPVSGAVVALVEVLVAVESPPEVPVGSGPVVVDAVVAVPPLVPVTLTPVGAVVTGGRDPTGRVVVASARGGVSLLVEGAHELAGQPLALDTALHLAESDVEGGQEDGDGDEDNE